MRAKTVGALSALGMSLTSVTVYSVTPNGGFGGPVVADVAAAHTVGAPTDAAPPEVDASHFVSDKALHVEGRLGHAAVQRGARAETYVLFELEGAKDAPVTGTSTGSLAIVLDQSGSMRGTRLANAKSAALRAIEGLHDGDSVSVVTFDTRARVVVPPTPLDAASRKVVSGAVQAIALGGDTCISCGVETGMSELLKVSSATSSAKRLLVLSDGDANNGIRDAQGFRDLGKRALDLGVEITTVGVSLEYNEIFLAAVAETSNGRHYFVENDAGLSKVFADEARFATGTVASDIVVELDLAPGVELTRVFDRTFTRSGSSLRIPVGALSRGEHKTVLLQVVLPGGEGSTQPVATAHVRHHDAASGDTLATANVLAAKLVDDPSAASPLDGVVAARLQRVETARVLEQANELFRAGKVDEARKKLASGKNTLGANAEAAKQSAPKARQKTVGDDFDDQSRVLDRAQRDFESPAPAAEPAGPMGKAPPAPPKPSPGTKRNVESVNAYRR